MKFQCSSCGLRLESLHFKLPGLVNDRLASLCDICRQRGLDPAAYPIPWSSCSRPTSFMPL